MRAHHLRRLGMHRYFAVFAVVLLLLDARVSYAYGQVYIPDASLLQYQLTPGGRVYFRNLNQFNGNALGCCYNYWIDTTTENGKNIFALFMSKAAQGKGLYFLFPDGGATGSIDYVGEW